MGMDMISVIFLLAVVAIGFKTKSNIGILAIGSSLIFGTMETLMSTGAIIRTAFCGPCFGAGDTPANDCLSVRHTTRNFPNREGSKPSNGEIASVALMDARSVAATAGNTPKKLPELPSIAPPCRHMTEGNACGKIEGNTEPTHNERPTEVPVVQATESEQVQTREQTTKPKRNRDEGR